MASSQSILIALIASIVVLSAFQTRAQSPSAPAPAPSGPLNFTGILAKAGQYNTFIHLLTIETQVAKQIENQLNTSTEGLTVFAPTDNAFNSLKSGTLNDLSTEKQVELLLYHVLPKFYSLQSLVTVSNPVRTQANYGLNFTGQPNTNQVNVTSSGDLVETQVNNAVYQQSPLAVYQVDKVLLPAELFESPAPASSPPAPATKSSGSSNTTSSGPAASDNSNSGSRLMNVWSGLVAGVVAICMGSLL